jgi:imidazolonepropionase-like amidohydrolase
MYCQYAARRRHIRAMRTQISLLIVLMTLLFSSQLLPQEVSTIAFINGRWFDGQSFQARTAYSVNGVLRFTTPETIDRTIDLEGDWIVPPFAEAHNHNIDGAVEGRALAALRQYAKDGVLYVKIQGNYPLSDEMRASLPMNRPGTPDVLLAQTFLTATGGHPIALHESILFAQGFYPGLAREDLKDRVYFTIDTADELEAKWPEILKLRPDFIKANLWYSDEHALRRNDAVYYGRKAMDASTLELLVKKAHEAGLRVSVHIANGADFRSAVRAGVDEIVHAPGLGSVPEVESRVDQLAFGRATDDDVRAISAGLARIDPSDPATLPFDPDDARSAARRGVSVVTTMANQMNAPPPLVERIRGIQAATLRTLRDNGVAVTIGSDNVRDTSLAEARHIATLGVYSNLEVLKLWTETTPRALFPGRRIGELRDGYEASFLVLEGNPLDDFGNVSRIRSRFKQGVEVDPALR